MILNSKSLILIENILTLFSRFLFSFMKYLRMFFNWINVETNFIPFVNQTTMKTLKRDLPVSSRMNNYPFHYIQANNEGKSITRRRSLLAWHSWSTFMKSLLSGNCVSSIYDTKRFEPFPKSFSLCLWNVLTLLLLTQKIFLRNNWKCNFLSAHWP